MQYVYTHGNMYVKYMFREIYSDIFVFFLTKHIYMYMYKLHKAPNVFIYIYIFGERERERDPQRESCRNATAKGPISPSPLQCTNRSP